MPPKLARTDYLLVCFLYLYWIFVNDLEETNEYEEPKMFASQQLCCSNTERSETSICLNTVITSWLIVKYFIFYYMWLQNIKEIGSSLFQVANLCLLLLIFTADICCFEFVRFFNEH